MTINVRNPQPDEQLLREYLDHQKISVTEYQQFDPWSKIELMRACNQWGNEGKPRTEQPPSEATNPYAEYLSQAIAPTQVTADPVIAEDEALEHYLRIVMDGKTVEDFDKMTSWERVSALRNAVDWVKAGAPKDAHELTRYRCGG